MTSYLVKMFFDFRVFELLAESLQNNLLVSKLKVYPTIRENKFGRNEVICRRRGLNPEYCRGMPTKRLPPTNIRQKG